MSRSAFSPGEGLSCGPAEAEEIERQRREESEALITAFAVKLRLVISIEGWL